MHGAALASSTGLFTDRTRGCNAAVSRLYGDISTGPGVFGRSLCSGAQRWLK